MTWAGTFHSIAIRLLRHYARHLKLDPQFSVADRGDAADIMDGLRMELSHLREIFATKDALAGLLSIGKAQPVFEGV